MNTKDIKAKVAAKVAKGKAKIAAKCGKKRAGKCAAFAAAALGLAILCGCATSESAQPAKSQTQNNTFDDCIFVVATQCSVSNRFVYADGTKDAPAIDLFTQAQSLESSGTESFAQTATQTPTTDVKPDLDVRYNDAIAGATSASKGVLDMIKEGKTAVLELMSSKGTGTVEVQKKDGTTAVVECKDGQCEVRREGT